MTLLHGSTLLTAYAVARDFCNGKFPSCSSQAARKWYGPCPWRGAFSRGRPSLWPRKNSFFFVTAFLMAISINRLIGFVNGWFSRGKGKISRVKQKETSFRMSLFFCGCPQVLLFVRLAYRKAGNASIRKPQLGFFTRSAKGYACKVLILLH